MAHTTPEDTRRHQLPADLGAELRAARWARGLALRAAARNIGISCGYLAQLERAERCPSVEVARALAAALELDPKLAMRLLTHARPDAGRSWDPTSRPAA